MISASKIGAVLLLITSGAGGETWKPCSPFKSKVQVTPSVLNSGASPRFVLELVNQGRQGIRLLDVRNGRRSDLADTYYKLVVRRADGAAIDSPRQISDPGPISEADFFVLEPAARVSFPVRSLVSLEALVPGAYLAYVSIWQDPYSVGSVCRSDETEFRVQ